MSLTKKQKHVVSRLEERVRSLEERAKQIEKGKREQVLALVRGEVEDGEDADVGLLLDLGVTGESLRALAAALTGLKRLRADAPDVEELRVAMETANANLATAKKTFDEAAIRAKSIGNPYERERFMIDRREEYDRAYTTTNAATKAYGAAEETVRNADAIEAALAEYVATGTLTITRKTAGLESADLWT